uniref:Uncharacterized protein n=1 Tax=Populus trichocarpa TaxID=3694 RepID=A0A3N7G1Z5_POPTR
MLNQVTPLTISRLIPKTKMVLQYSYLNPNQIKYKSNLTQSSFRASIPLMMPSNPYCSYKTPW